MDEMQIKDIWGRVATVGDIVALVENRTRGLVEGEIVKITPKGVKIQYENYWGSTVETFRPNRQFAKC